MMRNTRQTEEAENPPDKPFKEEEHMLPNHSCIIRVCGCVCVCEWAWACLAIL